MQSFGRFCKQKKPLKTGWTTRPFCGYIHGSYMKNSPLVNVLLVLTAVSAVLSVVLCWSYITSARQLRILQQAVAAANQNRAVLNALATEAVEYGKTNPAINPLLEQLGARPLARTNTPAPKAGK